MEAKCCKRCGTRKSAKDFYRYAPHTRRCLRSAANSCNHVALGQAHPNADRNLLPGCLCVLSASARLSNPLASPSAQFHLHCLSYHQYHICYIATTLSSSISRMVTSAVGDPSADCSGLRAGTRPTRTGCTTTARRASSTTPPAVAGSGTPRPRPTPAQTSPSRTLAERPAATEPPGTRNVRPPSSRQ